MTRKTFSEEHIVYALRRRVCGRAGGVALALTVVRRERVRSVLGAA
ncbi:MAG: hypothetical protein M3Q71_21865 [Chloroflexota bacterium]|nr:hypothetical protein [Chloroflexota bacterium]MDP9473275.1 hypothetical protein [Chloroflexota bacterium]